MNTTWKDIDPQMLHTLVESAGTQSSTTLNGPVWEDVYEVTAEDLLTYGYDLYKEGRVEDLEELGYSGRFGLISDFPLHLEGTYLVSSHHSAGSLITIQKDEEPND